MKVMKIRDKGTLSKTELSICNLVILNSCFSSNLSINLGFWEMYHLPLPYVNNREKGFNKTSNKQSQTNDRNRQI